jgi:hypothetical protein
MKITDALESPLKVVYHSFEAVNKSPFCISDPEQDIKDNHSQSSEPLDNKADISSHVPDSTLTKITRRYKRLKLPSILHYFPANNYRHIPMFDGELEKISTEKHVQNFEHFADLVEIKHDNVLMRVFSLSLQGDIK